MKNLVSKYPDGKMGEMEVSGGIRKTRYFLGLHERKRLGVGSTEVGHGLRTPLSAEQCCAYWEAKPKTVMNTPRVHSGCYRPRTAPSDSRHLLPAGWMSCLSGRCVLKTPGVRTRSPPGAHHSGRQYRPVGPRDTSRQPSPGLNTYGNPPASIHHSTLVLQRQLWYDGIHE